MVPVVQHAQVDSVRAEVCPGFLQRCHTIDLAPTMDVAIDFAVSTVSSGRIRRRARVWYVHARTTFATYWLNVNAQSSVTPNNFTASAKCTTVPATLTPADVCMPASRWRVPKMNNMKLVHWPLTGVLLHLVQRWGDWAGPRPFFTVPNVTAHPSTASVLITVLLYNGPLLCGFFMFG